MEVIVMKHHFTVLLCLIFCLSLVSCAGDRQFDAYAGDVEIAIKAKVYPTVSDDLLLSVEDADSVLSNDDISHLAHYVDVWASLNDQRGDGFLEDEAREFVSDDTIQSVQNTIQNNTLDYKVEGTQIITIKVDSDGRVQIPYIALLTGSNPKANIPEGKYEAVQALYFKKIDGKWYQDGISFLFMAEAGTVKYERDDITGHYTITPTGTYYK